MQSLKNRKVSIAMTTYNGSKYLIEQLESIKNQTRQPDEVIICDDCSTDNTYQMTADFIEENELARWTVIQNEKNLGAGDNFVNAILMTSGDIVFLADQDDVWRSDKIEKMTDIIENNENVEVLACRNLLIDGEGNEVKTNWKFNGCVVKPTFSEVFKSSRGICKGCLMVFSSAVREDIRRCRGLEKLHDEMITMIGLMDQSFYSIDMPLIQYRLHDNNASMPNGIHGVSGGNKINNDLQARLAGLKNTGHFHAILKMMELRGTENDTFKQDVENWIFVNLTRAGALENSSILAYLKYRRQITKVIPIRIIISDLTYILHLRTVAIKLFERLKMIVR